MNRLHQLAIACIFALGLGAVAHSQGFQLNGLPNGSQTNPTISGQTQTKGIYFNAKGVGITGHVNTSNNTGNAPVLSTCGTSPSLGTGSSDTAGSITVGTTASNACTLTFGTAFTTAPFCIVQNKTTGAAANVYTVSTTAIVFSSALADSTQLYYVCVGPAGG